MLERALSSFGRRSQTPRRFSPFRRSPLDILLGRWTLDTSPVFIAFDLLARVFSPYDLNPRGVNPLTTILAECIDFKRLAKAPIKLFVTATNVNTGRGRVFRNERAYARRPACVGLPANDVPGHRDRRRGLLGWGIRGQSDDNAANSGMRVERYDPDSGQSRGTAGHPAHGPAKFSNRVNEVSFNATLLKELRMIAVLRQVSDPGSSEGARWAEMRIHRVASDMITGLALPRSSTPSGNS